MGHEPISSAFDAVNFEPPISGADGGDVDARDAVLPGGSPIEPLGLKGEEYYYLDELRQIRILKPKDHSRSSIISLLGTKQNWAWLHYEGKKEDGDGNWVGTGKLRTEKLGDELMRACALRGVWDPLDRLRESGAWPGGDGGLVLHCGDGIYAGGKWHEPGRIGKHVYPAQPPTPRPDPRRQTTAPAEELLALLETWQWRRGALDARLMLGWIGAAPLGGALGWRTPAWITGDAGTGKSSLHDVVQNVISPGAMVYSSDPTAAGIWQKLGLKTLPVALDEIEAEEDNRQVQKVIKLARQAASGGVVLRGGDSHKGSEFKAQSSFLFSSILVPPLLPADKSRIAVLELKRLPEGSAAPRIVPDRLGDIGRRLLGRLVQKWDQWPGVLAEYRAHLAALGHSSRGCDSFGTLLAIADLLLTDHPGAPAADEPWAQALEPETLGGLDSEDADQKRCLTYLLTSQVDLWQGGHRKTIADVVSSRYRGGEDEDNQKLMAYGIGVCRKSDGRYVLAVANDHRALATLYRDTHWAAKPGAGGGWVQSLRRLEGAEPGQQRFDGMKSRCTEIPMSTVFPEGV